jgi:hypothetical protein
MRSVPDTLPGADWSGMFALEAALNPLKPSCRALLMDSSSPRYARRACSSELTSSSPQAVIPTDRKREHATVTTREKDGCMPCV